MVAATTASLWRAPSIVGASFSWGAQGAAVGAVGARVDGIVGQAGGEGARPQGRLASKVGTHAAMFGARDSVERR